MADSVLVLYVKRNGLPINRIGISVSRKVGNAVKRNRIRRLIKEQIRLYDRLHGMEFRKGYDLVVVARKAAVYSGFDKIGESLLGLLKKQKVL